MLVKGEDRCELSISDGEDWLDRVKGASVRGEILQEGAGWDPKHDDARPAEAISPFVMGLVGGPDR
jgi:hypothetical protein